MNMRVTSKPYVTNRATLLTKSGPSCRMEVESWERHEVPFTRTFRGREIVFTHNSQRCESTTNALDPDRHRNTPELLSRPPTTSWGRDPAQSLCSFFSLFHLIWRAMWCSENLFFQIVFLALVGVLLILRMHSKQTLDWETVVWPTLLRALGRCIFCMCVWSHIRLQVR